ncbi:myeloid-associated differentiation marker-like protein 2 [Lepisosteus oculatus]|uniref:myeloid-associated differentiation marker-like protein 2 n=1 Tax=Lepisosteus oculatus TaxID=7918 RepID=UPI0035F51566
MKFKWKLLRKAKGILLLLEIILSLLAFSLAASRGFYFHPYEAWCMFVWVFCFLLMLAILVLQVTLLYLFLPIKWKDFTTAMAMLCTLMVLSASVIYSVLYVCWDCITAVAVAIVSFLCFLAYAVDTVIVKRKRKLKSKSGYLSNLPGFLGVLESFVACILFASVGSYFTANAHYFIHPALKWCVFVYAVCFPVTVLIIVLNISPLIRLLCFAFDKAAVIFHVLAVLLYASAVVLWPLYGFRNHPRPSECLHCSWDDLVVVTVMTVFNLIFYLLDLYYCFKAFMHR